VVEPAMRAAADDVAGPDLADRLYGADVRDLMGLFVQLRRLLTECAISDFGFADLYRPTYARLQKILSYIINFVRFREEQAAAIDRHFAESERAKLRVQELYADKERLEARLAQLQRERAATDRVNRQKEDELAELKPRLLDLDRKKGRLVQENARTEDEKRRLAALLDERGAALDAARADAAKLRPYALQLQQRAAGDAPLDAAVRDLAAAVAADRAAADALERRGRALRASADGFGAAAADVAAVARLLADLAADAAKEDDELAKAARHREALSDRSNVVQDVERQERLMQKQLASVNARTEKLRRAAEERGAAAAARMAELKELHGSLQRERNERAREIEKRRVRIEQTEKKVCVLPFPRLRAG
jgi:kinetochore protein Nuf2